MDHPKVHVDSLALDIGPGDFFYVVINHWARPIAKAAPKSDDWRSPTRKDQRCEKIGASRTQSPYTAVEDGNYLLHPAPLKEASVGGVLFDIRGLSLLSGILNVLMAFRGVTLSLSV